MLALALLLLLATPGATAATPSPTPKPLAVPAPGSTPWNSLSLAAVTLGDSADDVRARLGEPAQKNQKPEIEVWTYPFDSGHVEMSVFMRHGRVTSVIAALSGGAKQSLFVDPYGLHLGDGVDTMYAARGQPSDAVENRNVYATGPGFQWTYQFDRGLAASIVLEATVALAGPLPQPVAGPPGHDGLSLDKPIRFKVASRSQAHLYEDVFLAQFCDGKGTWAPGKTAVFGDQKNGFYIEARTVECSTTRREATYYFDLSGLPAR